MTQKPDDIKQLEKRIAELKRKEAAARKEQPESEYARASKAGFRVATELISAVIVGAAIGYLLDDWFGTKPWLMVAFLLTGGAAGMLNVYRFVQGEERKTKE